MLIDKIRRRNGRDQFSFTGRLYIFVWLKKLLTIVVLLTYLLVSSGFVVSFHYCMDQYDSFDIGRTADDKCRTCGMHKEGGCCKDEVMVVKLDNSHIPSNVLFTASFSTTLPSITSDFFIATYQDEPQPVQITHSPPLPATDRYISNCVFRI